MPITTPEKNFVEIEKWILKMYMEGQKILEVLDFKKKRRRVKLEACTTHFRTFSETTVLENVPLGRHRRTGERRE